MGMYGIQHVVGSAAEDNGVDAVMKMYKAGHAVHGISIRCTVCHTMYDIYCMVHRAWCTAHSTYSVLGTSSSTQGSDDKASDVTFRCAMHYTLYHGISCYAMQVKTARNE